MASVDTLKQNRNKSFEIMSSYDFTILVIFVNFTNYITNMQEFGGQEIMDENFHSHYALVYSFFVFILQIWRIVFDYRILILEILPK